MTEGRGCRAMAKKRGCVVEVYHAAAPRNDRERGMPRNDKRKGCVVVVCHCGYFIFIENKLANT